MGRAAVFERLWGVSKENLAMTQAERQILAIFRRFRVGPNKMLCMNTFVNDEFLAAMEKLIKRKLVVKDRPKHAYYLTHAGYGATLME